MQSASAIDPSASVGAKLVQLRELLREHRFNQVLAAANDLLVTEPGQRDALLFAAMAQRFLGKLTEALGTLARLEQHHPRFSRLFEERGRCFVALRQAQPAIDAFVQAVQINHALLGSWGMLEGLYRMRGDSAAAATAARENANLRALPQEVVIATGLFVDGDLEAAETLIRSYLLKHGDHVEAMRLLARIGMAHGVYFDAHVLLAAVLERAPDYRAARQEYAYVLTELHRYEEALEEVERLMAGEPDDLQLKILSAAALVGLGEHERAITLYRELLTGGAADAETHLSIGHALKTLGRTEEAVASYRRAAECRADFGDAYWSLANLKTYRFTPQEQSRIQSALATPSLAPVDRYHLCFAMGKALEDEGHFAESFRYYERGNDLKRIECRYRPELIEHNTQQQIRICTAELFAKRQGWGHPSSEPIFIVGLPRSGSTLLEQILASHSQVEGTQELPNIQQIVSRLRGFGPETSDPRYPRILTELSADEMVRLGAEYVASTRAYRSGKPFFIDKMPNNFRHVGLIHLMLPNARIIDARREPMACCFSNFKQLFANGQEFTYSVEHVARYYRTYLELMRHWERVLPGRVLRVQHEDLIDDLEGSVRRLLSFCKLEFEPQCLAFHKNRRSVRTASSEQVRQEIFREGLDHWKHFEPWLGALQEALGDAVTRYREGADALTNLPRSSALQPSNPDALVDAADAQRALGRSREAVTLYQEALHLDPTRRDAHNNLGNAFLDLGEVAEAMRCYRQALRLRPDDAQVLCNLGNALRQLAQFEEAMACSRRAIDLSPRLSMAHNNLGLLLLARGKRAAAIRSYQEALRHSPTYIEALSNLGNALREEGQRRDALTAHQQALQLDPRRPDSHSNLGYTLLDCRQVEGAAASFRAALGLNPDQVAAHLGLAIAQRAQGLASEAQISCQTALELAPQRPDALLLLGELYADRGQFVQAQGLFERALVADQRYAPAYSSIAVNRRMTRDDTVWLQGAQTLAAQQLPLDHEIQLQHALGKYCDDIGEYDQAFAHHRAANELTKRYGRDYDAAGFTALIERVMKWYGAAAVRSKVCGASDSERPVFIIGMPRSGTSLAEQILASHPSVFGAGEVKFWDRTFTQLEQALQDQHFHQCLGRTAEEYSTRVGARAGTALRIVDKLPANFLYVGLICSVFPRARFIHMQRHPLDTCVSVYFQNFFNVGPYANDLTDLAHYYGEYRRMMAYWRGVLSPRALLEVPYEALVADPEGWTRRMLEFVGLPWDAKCLDPHRTERVVMTASKWQVRQKITTASVGRWRNYASHIGPMRHLEPI